MTKRNQAPSIDLNEININLLDVYIGKRLKLRRVMLHMSQDELACMIGVTFQQVQKYENGANRISASRLFLIAMVLQVEASFFFEGIIEEHPEIKELLNPDVDTCEVREDETIFDPLNNTETLRLVNAYWKMQDPEKRKKILEFIISMTNS